MWSQSWKPLIKNIRPFPLKPSFDVTSEMKRQKYDSSKMVKLADNFFVSLGFKPVPKDFFTRSQFKDTKDGKSNCMATSWDLCDGQDFRIKMCLEPTMSHLITLHHEMGHIK